MNQPFEKTPFFLDSCKGKRFAVHYQPAGPCRGSILFSPPFAEELNKSRRTISMQASRLASTGYSVLVIDLLGTGDSSGDFRDARWETWRDDLELGASWLRGRDDRPLTLWGMRLGALLALDCAEKIGPDGILLWHPVTSGEAFTTQFLRLRVAGEMMEGTKLTVKDLRRELASNGYLEVAGYEISSELFDSIDRLKLSELGLPQKKHLWMEIVQDESAPLPPATERILEQWKNRGIDADYVRVKSTAFWSTQEITDVPEFVEKTTELLSGNA